jgi:methionyl-tRNA synthetase
MPTTTEKINAVLGHNPAAWPGELAWGATLTGRKVAEALVLFPRPQPDKAPAKS